MELLYQVKQGEDERAGLKRILEINKPVCAISVRNLVAFTSCSDLSRKKSKSKKTEYGAESPSGSTVYVADMNTPWDCHLVKSNYCCVTHLEWDTTGVQLLVGSEDGQVEVYGMVEDLLNKWAVLYSAHFRGEPILASCWISAPRQVCLVPDKLDSMLYSEKYTVRAIRRGRGLNKSLEGAILASGTGLLGVVIRSPEDSSKAITSIEKIIPLRNQLLSADMAYGKGGEIIVVSSSEKISHPIKLSRVNVSLVGSGSDKAEITINAGHSLFLPNIPDHSVSSVKFLNKVRSDSLLVALRNMEKSSSLFYLYELVAQSTPLKPRFQGGSGVDNIQTFKWQQIQKISFPSAIEEFCTLGIPISNPLNISSIQPPQMNQQLMNITNTIQPLIALSLASGNLHFLRTDNFQQIGMISGSERGLKSENRNLIQLKRDPDEIPDAKQSKISTTCPEGQGQVGFATPYVSLQFTWSGCLLLALDKKSQLSLYKIHLNMDGSTATSLIELSMMGGLDPWDILMCLNRPNLIENISDRLSETFARQPPILQGHYNTRILVIKAALYRLGCGGVTRSNDQQTLLTLHLVSGALKALLRPRNLSSHDRGPAEALSNLLSSKGEALSDVDKVLLHLEAKEYAVEPTLLQSLQQFLQWCADLSLKLLAILPDLRHSRAPGWEICRDSKAVGTLRELIVLMRIWGLIRPACLPSFRKTTDNLDVLPLLFRLLTKLSVTPHDPDESLIDDILINPPTPERQQVKILKNETAYRWFYVAMGFAGLVLILLIIGFLWTKRKSKDREREEMRNFPFTSPPDSGHPCLQQDSSIFDPQSMITSPVQPRSEHLYDKMSYPYPIPTGHIGRPMTFGSYKLQPPNENIHLQMQNEALLETLEKKRTSGISLGRNDSSLYIPGRHDSLDAYYALDPAQKSHLQTKMEESTQFTSYLHLTSDITRIDSVDVDDSDTSTVSFSNQTKPNFSQ